MAEHSYHPNREAEHQNLLARRQSPLEVRARDICLKHPGAGRPSDYPQMGRCVLEDEHRDRLRRRG